MRIPCALSATLIALCIGTFAPAQEAVFLIRHAEKATGPDPALTPDGRARAARWADMLRTAELDHIFTSDAQRTRETGAIIAEHLSLPITSLAVGDTAALLDALTFDHDTGRVLVVGHTETLPGIAAALGATGDVAIESSDFSTLLILTPKDSGTTLLRLNMP